MLQVEKLSQHRTQHGVAVAYPVTMSPGDPAASGDILLSALRMPWATVSPGAGQGRAEGAWPGLDLVAAAQSSPAQGQSRCGTAARHVPAPCASAPPCQARRKCFIYWCYF